MRPGRALSPHLPRGRPGKPRVDDRTVISGILHVLKTGCRWRDVPPVYGPPTTIYNRYNRWSQRRVWQRIFEKHGRPPAPFQTSFPSTAATSKRIARRAASRSLKKRSASSRGGRTSKICMLWPSDRGRPVAFALTPGNVADVVMAIPLLGASSQNQSACWRTRPTTQTACADGSSKGRSEQPFPPPPPGAPRTRSIAPPISAETSSNACSAS